MTSKGSTQSMTTKSKVLQEQIDDLQAGIIRLAQADVARLEYQKQASSLYSLLFFNQGYQRSNKQLCKGPLTRSRLW